MNKSHSEPLARNARIGLDRTLLLGIVGGVAMAALVLLIGWYVTYQLRPQQAQQAVQDQSLQQALVIEATALDQLDAGNHEVTISLLTEAMELAPRRSELYYYRAVALSALSEFEQAMADFDIAVETNPHWALPLAGRGSANAALGQLDEAVNDFTKAIHLEPNQAALYTNRGQIYHQRGKLSAAREDYDTAIRLSPDSVAARFNRGVLLYALGQHEPALKDFSRAIEVDPTHAPPYFNRGLIQAELGNAEPARTDLTQFIALSDNAEWVQIAEDALAGIAEHGEVKPEHD